MADLAIKQSNIQLAHRILDSVLTYEIRTDETQTTTLKGLNVIATFKKEMFYIVLKYYDSEYIYEKDNSVILFETEYEAKSFVINKLLILPYFFHQENITKTRQYLIDLIDPVPF